MLLKRLLFAAGVLCAALAVGACHSNSTASVGNSNVGGASAGGTTGSPGSSGTIGGTGSSGATSGGTIGSPVSSGAVGNPSSGSTAGGSSSGDGSSTMWDLAYYLQPDADRGTLPISAIPWSMYTEVAQGFILPAIGANGAPAIDAAHYRIDVNAKAFISAAHAHHTRALISMTIGSDQVQAIQNDTSEENIDRFVALIGQFVRNNDYDGVDIDWEAGYNESRIVSFITKLRQELPRPRFTLTFAANVNFRYALAQVADELDQINIMAYDWYFTNYTGQTVDYAWYNTSILAGPNVKMGDDLADRSLEEEVWWYVVSGKIPVKKLGVLVPFYGRIEQGVTEPGDILKNDPIPWPYLGWARLIKSKYWTDGEHHWDDAHEAPYISYYGESSAQNAFVTYTDPRQIMEFVKWAKANGLGGMGSFELPYEYLPEESGDARYPLSSVLHTSINATSAQLDAWIAQEQAE